MLFEQISEFELRGSGSLCPRVIYIFLQLVIFMTKQKSLRKFLTGLLFTAKILYEAIYLTSPYLGQRTYKIKLQNARF